MTFQPFNYRVLFFSCAVFTILMLLVSCSSMNRLTTQRPTQDTRKVTTTSVPILPTDKTPLLPETADLPVSPTILLLPSPTRDAFTATPSPRSIANASSTPSSIGAVLQDEIRLAFMQVIEHEQAKTWQIWVTNSIYDEPHLVTTLANDIVPFNEQLVWSNNGNYLAFSHYTRDRELTVSILDVHSGTLRQLEYTSRPYSPDVLEHYTVLFPSSWSIDDTWLTLTVWYATDDSGGQLERSVLVNVLTNEAKELAPQINFGAWSPTHPHQFVYVYRPLYPNIGKEKVYVREASIDTPIISFESLDAFQATIVVHMIWSPDGRYILYQADEDISVGNLLKFKPAILRLDIEQTDWDPLPIVQEHLSSALAAWSPDGRWVAFHGPKLWGAMTQVTDVINVSTISDGVVKSWLPDSSGFICQEDNRFFFVNVDHPNMPLKIWDAADYDLPSDSQISMWVIPHQ
ncbi:MAG: PD40 domain-containing protein [Ardenticatenales bacterium]|nr:PD40 domain-containing protein [Ardenticatenales bacterium]